MSKRIKPVVLLGSCQWVALPRTKLDTLQFIFIDISSVRYGEVLDDTHVLSIYFCHFKNILPEMTDRNTAQAST